MYNNEYYDEDVTWYMIPGFNGYECDDYGHIRSMKYYKSNPGRILKGLGNNMYKLTTDNNDTVIVSYDYVYKLATSKNNINNVAKNIRSNNQYYGGGRNKVILGNKKTEKMGLTYGMNFMDLVEDNKKTIRPIYYDEEL